MLGGRKRAQSLSSMETEGSVVAARLASLSVFKGLGKSAIRNIIAAMHVRVYRKDDLIIQEGERGRSLFLVLSGSAVAYSEKSECVLSRMTSGTVFGELAALYDINRTASVRAGSNICKVAVLEQAGLETALHSPTLLDALRERAKGMLLSDSQRFRCLQPVQSVSIRDMQVFDGSGDWKEETVRLFLADVTKCRAGKGAKVPLDDSHVFMIVKGQVSLFGVGPRKKALASSGSVVVGGEYANSTFDFMQAESLCIFILAPKSVYLSFLQGISLYAEEPMLGGTGGGGGGGETGEQDEGLRRKKARTLQGAKVDFSLHPSSVVDSSISSLQMDVQSVNLDGCWQISDPGLLFITNHLSALQELSIADCWSLTAKSLLTLSQLSQLKSLSMANLEAVDEAIVAGLPKSVEMLDVSFCPNIGDLGCLDGLCRLRKLTAKRCLVQRATTPLSCHLEALDLSECHLLTDDALRTVLDHNRCIKTLSLSFCRSLTVNSVSIICALKSLTELDVSNLDDLINDVSLKVIVDSLPCLTVLNVSYNHNLHDLLSLPANVERLVFDSCTGIDHKQRSVLSAKFVCGPL